MVDVSWVELFCGKAAELWTEGFRVVIQLGERRRRGRRWKEVGEQVRVFGSLQVAVYRFALGAIL